MFNLSGDYLFETQLGFKDASGEDKPDMQLEIFVDGERKKSVKIDSDNLFSFDKLLYQGNGSEVTGSIKL